MAAWFDRASSQGLELLTFPLSTFPISAGCWLNVPAVGIGTQCYLSVTASATFNNYATVYVDNAGVFTIEKTGGGTATVGTVTAGDWWYLLMRIISATSIRVSTLNGRTGVISHANNTSAGAMTGLDCFSVGNFRLSSPTNYSTGGVGELFITNNDCYSGAGQQADNSFIKKLAWDGPLSVPRVLDQLIEYRSLRSSPVGGHGDEILPGYRGLQNWTNTGGCVNGPHPPLPPGYTKLRPIPNLLTV